jgi:hypothetical protein
MARVRIPLLLCLALLASSAALAANVPENRSTWTTVSGVYAVTFHLSIASRLPAGSTITCRAQVVPSQGGPDLWNPELAATPVVATGQAAVRGPTATCATEIPFSWTVTRGRGEVVVSYEINAVSNAGPTPVLVRRSARQGFSTAFPAADGNTNLSVDLAF